MEEKCGSSSSLVQTRANLEVRSIQSQDFGRPNVLFGSPIPNDFKTQPMEIVDLIKEEQPDDFKPAFQNNTLSPFSGSFSGRSGQNIVRSLMKSENQTSKYDHFGLLKKLFPEQSDNVRDLTINAVIILAFRF